LKYLFTLILILALTGCKTVSAPYVADTKTVGGIYHYVKGGETLWSISRLYDVDIKSIINANNIYDTSSINRGQRLLIPGAGKQEEDRKSLSSKDSFVWPVRGTVISYFSSTMDRAKNKGIDIRAQEGSSVRASRAGKVVLCDQWLKGFGKTVMLDHGDNFHTIYAYNSMILVNIGDMVEQNSVIAKAGRTGRAKEPSLHFEIRRDGVPQNPFYYLSQ
jgi:murein DD-endopeptidase MepM/ murein hydrolase activator NlpD